MCGFHLHFESDACMVAGICNLTGNWNLNRRAGHLGTDLAGDIWCTTRVM